MKIIKSLFLTLLLSLMAYPLSAENNGLNEKIAAPATSIVLLTWQTQVKAGCTKQTMIDLSSDNLIVYYDDVPKFSCPKKYIKAEFTGGNNYDGISLSCCDPNINTNKWFKVYIELGKRDLRLCITENKNGDSSLDYNDSTSLLFLDGVGFYIKNKWGISDLKYETNKQKAFKYYTNFMLCNVSFQF